MSPRDEQMAAIRDTIPRMWWNLYQGAIQAGFTPYDAMTCLKAYILSQCPGGINPGGSGPESKGDQD